MGFLGKLANIASGGLLGMAKGIKQGNLKAIASGGMLSPQQRAQMMFGRAGVPSVSQEAQDYFNAQPETDQKNIMAGFGGRPDLQGWYENAKQAGSVPATPQPPPGATAALGSLGQSLGGVANSFGFGNKPAPGPPGPFGFGNSPLAQGVGEAIQGQLGEQGVGEPQGQLGGQDLRNARRKMMMGKMSRDEFRQMR